MGLAIIENGKLLYGDAQEFKNMQLLEIGAELLRMQASIEKLKVELESALQVVNDLIGSAVAVKYAPVPIHEPEPKPPSAAGVRHRRG